jgi:hypothetical protein
MNYRRNNYALPPRLHQRKWERRKAGHAVWGAPVAPEPREVVVNTLRYIGTR